MLQEEDILDLKFTKLDYSTDKDQYYSFSISREKDIQEDALNEYILKVSDQDDNKHQLFSKLKLGTYYNLNTKGWMGTFNDKEALYKKLMELIRWDISH